MKKIAYARVSTADQRHDRQIEGLRALCDEIHIETQSACASSRPVYDRVRAELQSGDMLVIWDLDRAFRSAKDALNELDALHKRGVAFTIASLSIDTTTPEGYFVYTIMSGLAEFERRMLSRRTKQGLAAARSRGARLGRPPVLNAAQLRDAQHRVMHRHEPVSIVAADLGVGRWTLARSLKRLDRTHDPA